MAILTEGKIKSIISNFIETADEKALKEMAELINKKITENFWASFPTE